MTQQNDGSEPVKAIRANVQIGSIEIDGFMLPDGSYRMSQTQAAETIGKPEINARRFLDSRGIKSLLGQGYTPDSIEIDAEQLRGQGRFNALPLEVVTAYWFYQATQGDKPALALVWALLTESLERRFDNAFNVTRTEQERDDRLTERIRQFERDLANLGEGFAIDENIRRERDFLEERLRSLGFDPWGMPENIEP